MDFIKGLDLVTQRLLLKDINPGQAKDIAEQYGLKADEVQFIRKGVVPSDLQFEEGERAVISYITTGAKDRDREIVEPAGAILDDYRKNPVVLFCHDYRQLPIGKNLWIKADNKGLIAKTVYAPHEEAEKVYQYRKAGFPLAESIGFVPIEWKDHNEADRGNNNGVRRTFTKWLLLEYSDVPVPSNPQALMIAVSKGLLGTLVHPVEVRTREVEEQICPWCQQAIEQKDLSFDGIYWWHTPCKEKGAIVLPAEKGACPYADHGAMPEDATWEAGKEVTAADVSDLKQMCAWFDSENAENKTAYKLPHHTQSGYKAVWRGVAAAMAALLGARGGVQIPEADKKAVYNHLAKEYKHWDKEPPEYKQYSEDELKEIIEKPGWDETENMIRYRVREPSLFQDGTFRTVPIKRDKPRVNSVMGKLKNQDTMTIQNLMFPKEDDWTLDSAKSWLGEHRDLLKQALFDAVLLAFDDALEAQVSVTAMVEDKTGRTLSEKTRQLIAAAISTMKQASGALDELLASADKPAEEEPAKSDDILEDFKVDTSVVSLNKDDIDKLLSEIKDNSGKEDIDIDKLIDDTIKKLQGKVL